MLEYSFLYSVLGLLLLCGNSNVEATLSFYCYNPLTSILCSRNNRCGAITVLRRWRSVVDRSGRLEESESGD